MQPFFFYAVGCASALVFKRGKRLGDLVAGTILVQERISGERGLRARPPAPGRQRARRPGQ